MRNVLVLVGALVLAAAAYADFKVVPSVDVVTLDDGTTLTGTVIAEGARGVVLVKDAKEVVIPKDKVVKVEKGVPTAETKGYTTDPVEGQKIVTGEGFRDSGSSEDKQAKDSEGKPATPQANAGKPGKVTADMVKNMTKQKPQLDAWVKVVGGPDKAAEILNDPEKRKEIEKTAKNFGVDFSGSGPQRREGKNSSDKPKEK
jgi:hypothetical protein